MGKDTALYKMGMVSITTTPNLFKTSAYFNQTLDMRSALFTLSAGGGSDYAQRAVQFDVYVDAASNDIFVDVTSPVGLKFDIAVEIFSTRPSKTFQYTPGFFCDPVTVSPDVFIEDFEDGIAIYHRNRDEDTDVMSGTLKQQFLDEFETHLVNHWTNRTFGFAVQPLSQMSKVSSSVLHSVNAASQFKFHIHAESVQTASVTSFVKLLATQKPENFSHHLKMWDSFWKRSYVVVNGSVDTGFEMNQKYVMTRYVHSIQSRTPWPIKFNGMAFVAHMMNDDVSKGPDYRDWGPSNWWQNTRFPYWSMLPNGDFDLFETVLQYYEQMLPFSSFRTEKFFNHTGIFFTETKTIFGSYAPSDYGCGNSRPAGFPPGFLLSNWTRFDYAGNAGGPEVAMMLLDHFMYTQDEATLKRYLPIASMTVEFFFYHYHNRTAEGKYIFWPTQALESFWCDWPSTAENCPNNDHPTVASMHALTTRLLSLPETLTTSKQRDLWRSFNALLPDFTLTKDGKAFEPAAFYVPVRQNEETPELYSVHPFRLFTLGKKITEKQSIERSINSFFSSKYAYSYNVGWNYGILNAALLGLTNMTEKMILERIATSPPQGYRFPGFAPHIQDFEPSADHYAVYNTAINWMLMQPADDAQDSILLFPAWPCNWEVSFKMYGPRNTIVEVVYEDGQLKQLQVTPAERKSDLIMVNCVN
eukprot:TRINITY_DN164_c0_g3_i1.p1 TRINITY_DN164_c0_g3~~TRINITY_DN164_c0_g3_i1.p1  ORF type:complete len:772 (-),score=187.26 TRINITY_DN164_c0_g3_i1:117-2207(-)